MRGPHGHHRHGSDGTEGDKPPIKITDRRMLGWFAGYLLPHGVTIAVATLAMVGSTAADLAPPLLFKDIIDDVIIAGHYERLSRYGLLLVAVFFSGSLLSGVRMNLMHRLGQRFVLEMRVNAYRHLQRLSLSFFERNKTGDIMSRLSNDVNSVEDMVVHGTDTVVSDGLRIVATIGLLLWLAWKLAFYALIPLPVFLTAVIIFSRFVRPIYRRIRDDLGDINTELQENIAGIRVIKAFAREEYEQESFERRSTDYYRANIKGIWMWTTFFPAINFVISCSVVLVMWIGAGMTATGEFGLAAVTPGVIVAFVGYLQQFYWRFGSLVRVYDLYNRAFAALGRIFLMLDEKPEVEDAPDAIELEAVEGYVELEHVSFKYTTGEMVLNDVSVEAKPGETVALVGRSGAGKTSLVNLIPRFYDPLEGRVLVDHRDVRGVTQQSLRSHIAMVLQETFLFSGTARNNILYGRLDATEEEVIEAAKAAYADEFIVNLPEGYDTEIGERGVKLSGGQAQRIAIARAVLADPRILILDEATSLVDTEAEQQIQAALESLMRGRTTFVIAHRLSTVRNADKIVVIDDGEVVETADHEALMERGGLYAEMYTRQFQIERELPGERPFGL